MKKLSLQEVKDLEVRIFEKFNEFCLLNNIKYSMAAGTLLGAVRHKGFIPWDDDIDVFMLKEEYDKFIECVGKCNNKLTEEIVLLKPGEQNYIYPFLKLVDKRTIVYEKNIKKEYAIGVWIDIFPLEYVYDDMDRNQKLADKQMHMFDNIIRLSSFRASDWLHSFVRKIYLIYLRLTKRDLEYWIQKITSFQAPDKSKYLGVICAPDANNSIYPADFCSEYTMLSFEGHQFMAFKSYKSILECKFGDYMQLPPEEERVSHGFDAYIKSNYKKI